jgi:signal transduction histidine kinase
VLGVLAAWQGAEPGSETREWASGDLEALATLADQAALLFEHAQGIDERATLERKREDLASRLREQDRLAMLGEMSARVAEEARQPLAGIAAIAARVLQDLPAEDPSREAFLAMEREIARVDRMLGEQLEYARLEPPRLRVEAFNTVVQEALRGSAEALARHRARVVKHYEPDLPQLLLDGARIRRVVGNIVAAALEQMPVGGRMRIETRRNGTWIASEVLHDRAREQGDALEQLFVPFAASLGPAGPTPPVPPSGAALGLGVAHQIVREHGGELRVRIEDEWSSAFVMTLPVLENQDRRKGPDRRGARRDRRRREEGEG